MKRLIVCADGTWNTPDQRHHGVPVPTNVLRIFNAFAGEEDADKEQRKYYHPGVGTEGNWWQRLLGGALGVGVVDNIHSSYHWLCEKFEEGDEIALFGFSRGAYTVRALAGMIGSCGLFDPHGLTDKKFWEQVKTVHAHRHQEQDETKKFHFRPNSKLVHFLGVWDTVGACGIPDHLGLLNLFDDRKKLRFRDQILGKNVLMARHALAIDEKRASFAPTLWQQDPDRIEQKWFPGVHSDIGGGYQETGLSDASLLWMAEEAAKAGFVCDPKMIPQQAQPRARGVLHDSYVGAFRHMRSQPRSIPKLTRANSDILHPSTLERIDAPPITQAPYRLTRSLEKLVGFWEEPIYAEDPWNELGLYLEAGCTYHFQATGEWKDKWAVAGPGGLGQAPNRKRWVHRLSDYWAHCERPWRRIIFNKRAELPFTRRDKQVEWLCLVGVIANATNPQRDGTPDPHETFRIGADCTYTPKESGYLYAFANDAWEFYANNRGSVLLKVTRC